MSAAAIGGRIDAYLNRFGSWATSHDGIVMIGMFACVFFVVQMVRFARSWRRAWADLNARVMERYVPVVSSPPPTVNHPPKITASTLARLAELCLDIAECIECIGITELDSDPRKPRPRVETSYVPAKSVEIAEILADLSDEFGNRPGFVSAAYDGKSIAITSRFDVWEAEFRSWMQDNAPDVPFTFNVQPAPKRKSTRGQRRCPKCQSLQMVPKSTTNGLVMHCNACNADSEPKSTITNRPAPLPSDPRFRTALGALEALSSDPSANNQTFAVQTRNVDDDVLSGE